MPTKVEILRSRLSLWQLHIILLQYQRHNDLDHSGSEEPSGTRMITETKVETRRRDTNKLVFSCGVCILFDLITFWIAKIIEAKAIKLLWMREVFRILVVSMTIESDPLAFRYSQIVQLKRFNNNSNRYCC